jgi:hypothetical protein
MAPACPCVREKYRQRESVHVCVCAMGKWRRIQILEASILFDSRQRPHRALPRQRHAPARRRLSLGPLRASCRSPGRVGRWERCEEGLEMRVRCAEPGGREISLFEQSAGWRGGIGIKSLPSLPPDLSPTQTYSLVGDKATSHCAPPHTWRASDSLAAFVFLIREAMAGHASTS